MMFWLGLLVGAVLSPVLILVGVVVCEEMKYRRRMRNWEHPP